MMNSGFLKTSHRHMKEIIIEISYAGPWKGIIHNNGDTQQISGFSDKTIHVHRILDGKWDLSFHCEKEDGSTNLLRVSIKSTDGAILEKLDTPEPEIIRAVGMDPTLFDKGPVNFLHHGHVYPQVKPILGIEFTIGTDHFTTGSVITDGGSFGLLLMHRGLLAVPRS